MQSASSGPSSRPPLPPRASSNTVHTNGRTNAHHVTRQTVSEGSNSNSNPFVAPSHRKRVTFSLDQEEVFEAEPSPLPPNPPSLRRSGPTYSPSVDPPAPYYTPARGPSQELYLQPYPVQVMIVPSLERPTSSVPPMPSIPGLPSSTQGSSFYTTDYRSHSSTRSVSGRPMPPSVNPHLDSPDMYLFQDTLSYSSPSAPYRAPHTRSVSPSSHSVSSNEFLRHRGNHRRAYEQWYAEQDKPMFEFHSWIHDRERIRQSPRAHPRQSTYIPIGTSRVRREASRPPPPPPPPSTLSQSGRGRTSLTSTFVSGNSFRDYER